MILIDFYEAVKTLQKEKKKQGVRTHTDPFAPGRTVIINSVDDLDISDVYDVYVTELNLDGKADVTSRG